MPSNDPSLDDVTQRRLHRHSETLCFCRKSRSSAAEVAFKIKGSLSTFHGTNGKQLLLFFFYVFKLLFSTIDSKSLALVFVPGSVGLHVSAARLYDKTKEK